MKLIYCTKCGDLFQLRHKMKKCECGAIKGRYIDNMMAEVSKEAISIAIGNGALDIAIQMMKQLKGSDRELGRDEYMIMSDIFYAWVRPNEGPGNPHTKVIKEK